MSTKAEQQTNSLDTIKLVVALVLLFVGIAGFYYFADWQGEPVSLLYRVLGLLAVMGVAAYIALTSASGKRLMSFMQDSRTEVRKMVWPTRVETMQTTLMVFVIVFILTIFLWLVDMLLGWGVKSLLGGG
ncbi:MAG: Preprotein translocase subunit SecE (TC 3.A.5.1.1) [uncultured Thiotrichaceae bacterium]|uniref:Protein translocase subunit SecE n=1 Tax=uncultured Thiotrichaceae bacterium TaxID=298394 RepID=A0A6S6SKN0_9GAMM|nr:MAG: Preprotein translocase subunit SecE (TC 3.A.5.1.1) [uncultured Thiotrichaceae bacterium]